MGPWVRPREPLACCRESWASLREHSWRRKPLQVEAAHVVLGEAGVPGSGQGRSQGVTYYMLQGTGTDWCQLLRGIPT